MPTRLSWRADLSDTISRLRALFADGSDSSLARRLAGAAFLIRVVSALLAFISQILLARWMGGFDFGRAGVLAGADRRVLRPRSRLRAALRGADHADVDVL